MKMISLIVGSIIFLLSCQSDNPRNANAQNEIKQDIVEVGNSEDSTGQQDVSQDIVETEVKGNENKTSPPETPPVKPKSVPKPEKEATIGKLEEVKTNEDKSEMAIDHKIWDNLLQKHVKVTGEVDYTSFKKDISTLDRYLELLGQTDVESLDRDEKLAFWINAYNAFTIKKILMHYPISSITDLDNGKPWDVKWIQIDGRNLSLNNIENDIIRPQFKEPRIHFAVNCAARSCPPLLNKAWTAENLEANLKAQTKKFINNSNHNSISKDKVVVSKIFEWYAEDFGDLVTFLNKYAQTSINDNAKILYKEYDWALNDI